VPERVRTCVQASNWSPRHSRTGYESTRAWHSVTAAGGIAEGQDGAIFVAKSCLEGRRRRLLGEGRRRSVGRRHRQGGRRREGTFFLHFATKDDAVKTLLCTCEPSDARLISSSTLRTMELISSKGADWITGRAEATVGPFRPGT